MNSPTVTEQAVRLAAVLGSVAGVTTALPRRPRSIQSSELPLIWLWAQSAAYSESNVGAGGLERVRDWQALIYVRIAGSGYENDPEIATEPLLDAIADRLASSPHLTVEDGAGFDVLLDDGGDEGITSLPFGSQWYIGTSVQFRTRVVDYSSAY